MEPEASSRCRLICGGINLVHLSRSCSLSQPRIVLAQPASASIVERINSEFAFVKDRRRNRLAHDKANKLVGLFHNLRLILRMTKTAYTEPTVGWMEDDEVKSGVSRWGIANY